MDGDSCLAHFPLLNATQLTNHSLFIPIFGLLGWWLLSPTPEPEIVNPNQTDSYEQMINKGKSVKARRF